MDETEKIMSSALTYKKRKRRTLYFGFARDEDEINNAKLRLNNPSSFKVLGSILYDSVDSVTHFMEENGYSFDEEHSDYEYVIADSYYRKAYLFRTLVFVHADDRKIVERDNLLHQSEYQKQKNKETTTSLVVILVSMGIIGLLIALIAAFSNYIASLFN